MQNFREIILQTRISGSPAEILITVLPKAVVLLVKQYHKVGWRKTEGAQKNTHRKEYHADTHTLGF